MSDHVDAVEPGLVVRLPVLQQVVQNRIELLLRCMPRLAQVVVDAGAVDRLDRRLRIGVGGRQDALGAREQLADLGEDLGSDHSRRAWVREEQGDQVVSQARDLRQLDPLLPGVRGENAEAVAVPAGRVARHRAEHLRIVVHGHQARSRHAVPVHPR